MDEKEMRDLTAEGIKVFSIGMMAGAVLACVGFWLALKCLELRGLW